jgi:hypothetical protein
MIGVTFTESVSKEVGEIVMSHSLIMRVLRDELEPSNQCLRPGNSLTISAWMASASTAASVSVDIAESYVWRK